MSGEDASLDDERKWEPALGKLHPPSPGFDDELPAQIAQLVGGERFCVLGTQGGGRPYASLLAFGHSPDLRQLVFATPVTTRKYPLLKACEQVAALIDSRSRTEDMMRIEAVTVLGVAEELAEDSPRHGPAAELYLAKHPQLASFVRAPSCALFTLTVERYLHVARFQDVREWRP